MPSAETKFNLCWCQRSPSKRHSQTKNPKAPRDDQGDAYTRIKMVAGSGNNPSLAYAMRMANQAYNTTPLPSHTDKQSPNKIFDNSAVDINQKHWKPFGCPAYVLKAELQGTTGIRPKWDARSRAGIYLGQSPIHNRNVALVLNIHIRYVSPQFHVKFDESFRTVQQDKWNATWLSSTRFMTRPNKVSPNEAYHTLRETKKTTGTKSVPKRGDQQSPRNRQMVAVTANGPARHTMSLAPEQQAPANPVSTIPPATVADELPVALERKPQPNVIPITTGQDAWSSLFQRLSI